MVVLGQLMIRHAGAELAPDAIRGRYPGFSPWERTGALSQPKGVRPLPGSRGNDGIRVDFQSTNLEPLGL